MRNVLESIQLFSRKDGADKEYQLRLVQIESGFVVEYSNGKRGSTLRHGLRTENPVDEATARKEYDRVLKSKFKDGYTGSESGEAFVGTELAGRKTVFAPQLLVAIDDSQAQAVLYHGRHAAQIKHNGERRYISLKDGIVTAANRNGLEVPIKEEIANSVLSLHAHGIHQVELDGEDMGSHYIFFDVLSFKNEDLRSQGFLKRFLNPSIQIKNALKNTAFEHLIFRSELLEGTAGKVDWADIQALRARGEEGVCFKEFDAPYEPGRPQTQYKLKFWETATARIKSKHPTKRSVALEMLNESNQWVGVGNVTEPANVPRPLIAGDLIDVRYLYAYQGGSLFEPTFDKIRDDLKESDALMSQLKFKRTAQAA